MRTEITAFVAVLAIALLSMLAFRVRRGAHPHSDEVARRGSFVGGNWLREWFYWAVDPVRRVSLAIGLPPEFFNGLGLLLGIASGFAFGAGRLPLGGALVLASGLTDAFDGLVARARGVASDAGAFLDSTLDRFTELAAFAGLVWWYQRPLPVLVLVLGLGGSMLVSYTRARGESLGVLCKLGVMQRAERLILVGLGSILDPTLSAALGRPTGTVLLGLLVVIAAGSLGTAVFRTLWITNRLKENR
ncbi:MAG: CDP-alcohol phosphatidyltransferase family protein [Gemmatimonadetes bacterium]|nr:CDP-alcohol phosphatidyltransferase family protein [Gemmatimonadota bacterium]